MKYFSLSLLFFLFLCASPTAQAQKDKDPKKESKKDKEAKPTAKDNTKNIAPNADNIHSLSREEKNTMTRCPLHGKHMDLSDNYRANASDFQQSDDYPFAKQLQYRRYCNNCTKAMRSEHLRFEAENKRNANKPTFDRCEVHNETMFVNGQFSALDYERNPNPELRNAQQYRFKFYCKTCTKLHKDVQKASKNNND